MVGIEAGRLRRTCRYAPRSSAVDAVHALLPPRGILADLLSPALPPARVSAPAEGPCFDARPPWLRAPGTRSLACGDRRALAYGLRRVSRWCAPRSRCVDPDGGAYGRHAARVIGSDSHTRGSLRRKMSCSSQRLISTRVRSRPAARWQGCRGSRAFGYKTCAEPFRAPSPTQAPASRIGDPRDTPLWLTPM